MNKRKNCRDCKHRDKDEVEVPCCTCIEKRITYDEWEASDGTE